MIKWEYKIAKVNVGRYIESDMKTQQLEDQLNSYGVDGWEVINIFDLNSIDGKSSNVIISMKRPLA